MALRSQASRGGDCGAVLTARLRFVSGSVAALVAVSCSPIGPFPCEGDEACRLGDQVGQCEPVGACSYEDDECGSKRRYSPHAVAEYAGLCVEEESDSEVQGESTTGDTTGSTSGGDTSAVESSGDVGPSCGNGTQEDGEDCDDGNTEDGDACSSDCRTPGTGRWSLEPDPYRQDDVGHAIVLGSDGLVVAGGTGVDAEDEMLVLECAVDGSGCSPWTRSGAMPGSTAAFDVATSTTGGYVLAGRQRGGSGDIEAWYGRVESSPEIAWQHSIPGAEAVAVGIDGADRITVAGHDDSGAWTRRVDAAGELDWERSYDGTADARVGGLTVGVSGEAVIVGYDTVPGTGIDAWGTRYSTLGAIFGTLEFTGPGDASDRWLGVALDAVSGVIVAGESGGSAWIGKYPVDASEPQWSDDVPSDGALTSVAVAPNGDVIAVGWVAGGDRDAWIGRWDPAGGLRWSHASERAEDDEYRDLAVTADGRLFVVGFVTVDGQRDVSIAELAP